MGCDSRRSRGRDVFRRAATPALMADRAAKPFDFLFNSKLLAFHCGEAKRIGGWSMGFGFDLVIKIPVTGVEFANPRF
jgi:hypothetical protein